MDTNCTRYRRHAISRVTPLLLRQLACSGEDVLEKPERCQPEQGMRLAKDQGQLLGVELKEGTSARHSGSHLQGRSKEDIRASPCSLFRYLFSGIPIYNHSAG